MCFAIYTVFEISSFSPQCICVPFNESHMVEWSLDIKHTVIEISVTQFLLLNGHTGRTILVKLVVIGISISCVHLRSA